MNPINLEFLRRQRLNEFLEEGGKEEHFAFVHRQHKDGAYFTACFDRSQFDGDDLDEVLADLTDELEGILDELEDLEDKHDDPLSLPADHADYQDYEDLLDEQVYLEALVTAVEDRLN